MAVRVIARELRVALAAQALSIYRSRSTRVQGALVERQRRDRRIMQFDSSKPAAIFATVQLIGAGKGVSAAAASATGGSGGGGGGGGVGGGGYYGGGGDVR